MSTQPRPDAVAPMELSKRGANIRTRLAVSSFERLSAVVAGGDEIAVELHFHRDDRGRCRIRGTASARLEVTCQRCLEPVQKVVSAAVDLCAVGSEEEARRTDAELNPVILGARATLVEIVEDELLLSLPTRVCDDDSTCPRRPQLEFPAQAAPLPERKSPFAALRDLAQPKKEQ